LVREVYLYSKYSTALMLAKAPSHVRTIQHEGMAREDNDQHVA